MPILVEPDSTTAGVLTSALPGGSQVVARPDEVEGWLNGRGEYALVIGPTLDMSTAVGLAERVRSGHPGTSIVLTRLELEPQVYAQAMQAGIGAVVAADDHACPRHRGHSRPHHLGGHPRPDRPARGRACRARCSWSSPPRAESARPPWRST